MINELLFPKPNHAIADLHCDLLCYLSRNSARTPFDPVARCSIPQLQKGNVKIQTMAIFTETSPGSVENGLAQAEIFKTLPQRYPDVFEWVRQPEQFDQLRTTGMIGILPAVENASSFCSENEELEPALQRLTTLQRKTGKLAYVSLTWNTENRFGGGALTNVGLKNDGKRLIDYLNEKGIAIDFSHASDFLAFAILDYIDKSGYELPVLASHSNFRTITNVPRNLPDDLAKEIWRRKGIVGLNLIRPFVGADCPSSFVRQLGYALQGLPEPHKGICLGADFFHTHDTTSTSTPHDMYYFPEFENAECYPSLIDLWRQWLFLSEDAIEQICYHNLANFLNQYYFK